MPCLLHFDSCVYFKHCSCFHVLAILKFLLIMALVFWVLKCVVSTWVPGATVLSREHTCFPLLVTVRALPLVLGCSCCPPDDIRAWSSSFLQFFLSRPQGALTHLWILLPYSRILVSVWENSFKGVHSLKWLFHIFICNLILLWATVWGGGIRSS